MWMGVFWLALGLFLLIYPLFSGKPYLIPGVNLNLGWLVALLGALRIWWWWKIVGQRRRFLAEQRKERLELEKEGRRLDEINVQSTSGSQTPLAENTASPPQDAQTPPTK